MTLRWKIRKLMSCWMRRNTWTKKAETCLLQQRSHRSCWFGLPSTSSPHVLVTFATLHTVSSKRFGFFDRKRAALRDILPLAAAMCLNVILPNLSLAYSSITFYQTARVLLTPITAFLNYVLYRKTIPRQAVCALVPVCAGVAMVTYFDVRPEATSKGTSFYGVVFAMSGVLMSGIYTCWIGHYHQRLQMTSLQLLHNQSLIGGMLLIYLIPFVDTLPVFSEVPLHRWMMIMMVRSPAYPCFAQANVRIRVVSVHVCSTSLNLLSSLEQAR
jgi:drug/metabolite transporter (DMT)-like permease